MGVSDGWDRDTMAFNLCVWVDVFILSFNEYFLST